MLHVFVRLANRITMGKIFSYSNLNQQEGCLVAGEGRRAHYYQCLSDGVIGIVSSWMKLQSVGKISRKFLEKLKKPEAEEFPLQQGQSSEFKHWKGWLRGDLHDESLQRNLNRNIRSGLWTCRELDWYVGGVQMWDFKNCVCVRSRRSMDSSTSAWWQGGAQSCSSSDVHSRRTSKSHRVVLKCSPLQQK